MPNTASLAAIPKLLTDTVRPWIEPFRRTEHQRDAARLLGRVGLGTMGVGGTAALLMMLRRQNERALLDEEKAKVQLPIPVYLRDDDREKTGSALTKAIAAGLATVGTAGTAAGLYYANDGKDGTESANPAARVFNTATGLIPGGQALREEQERYADLAGTIRGDHAKSVAGVPWFAPGLLGASLLGLGAGYTGINAMANALAKRKMRKRRDAANRVYEDALANEQRSKLGAALDEFVTACEEAAPSVKEASLLEFYLSMLGTAGSAGLAAGAYHGYHEAPQKHRLTALKKIRELQLARRRKEELSLVPEYHRLPSLPQEHEPEGGEDEPLKTADLVRTLGKGIWQGTKTLGRGTVKAAPKAMRTAAKLPKYLAKEQPLTTLTAGSLLAAEGLGRVADHYNSPWGQWKPSTWVFNRFADNTPLNDSQGNPVWGTRRLYSADPNQSPDMRWSWNPLSEGGFGWRFRKEQHPQRVITIPQAKQSVTELVRQSNPSIALRRKMNEQFYDYTVAGRGDSIRPL